MTNSCVVLRRYRHTSPNVNTGIFHSVATYRFRDLNGSTLMYHLKVCSIVTYVDYVLYEPSGSPAYNLHARAANTRVRVYAGRINKLLQSLSYPKMCTVKTYQTSRFAKPDLSLHSAQTYFL